MRVQTITHISTMLALTTVLGLTACNRTEDGRTVGQKVDGAVETIEQKTGQATTAVKKELDKAQEAGSDAADAAARKLGDAAITTSINAELARDPSLSALKINVDTKAGHVTLHGTAPTTADRDRATQLARGVGGVIEVDNQLQVRSN